MLTLESYLDGEYQTDIEDVRSLEATLERIAPTFERTFQSLPDSDVGYWEYEQKLDEKPKPPPALKAPADISQGTLAMVLAAIGKLNSLGALHDGSRARLTGINSELRDIWIKGVQTLTKSIEVKKCVFSTSFGTNDPVTLNHVVELLRSTDGGALLAGISEPARTALETLKGLMGPSETSIHKTMKRLCTGSPAHDGMLPELSTGKDYLQNAFVPVRVIRNLRVLQKLAPEFGDMKIGRAFEAFFEGTIHDQLSYSSILDSRFDPAELMFGLEGLLLCREQAVDARLFERVLDVLEQKQKESAHWRPSRPLYATSRGETMVPISVEGANSLLRSFAIAARRSDFACFSGKCTSMMRRFWHWLQARSVESRFYFGWHSEHVNNLNLIHIWDSSQVVEFMLDYRALLQRHIAHQTLTLSRVKVEGPVSLREQLETTGEVTWKDVVKKREPVRILGKTYRVLERIGEDFVQPWLARAPENFSMLLYGPPGTGKTALARLVAGALGFPLISISVSDFLGSGGALVEARAKAIFQMLEAQARCVILFDEIDSFLLDRDSTHYRSQDTIFQFLTPGMLTKIHDLREEAQSIFIIATNYENRIDPAIKRSGRVDRKYLLAPPDAARRVEMLKQRGIEVTAANETELQKESLYLGFTEIKSATSKAKRENRPVAEQLYRAERSTGAEFYGRRAYIDDPFPVEEAACLYCLAEEVGLATDTEPKGFKAHFDDGVDRAAMGAKKDPPPDKLKRTLSERIVKRAEEIKEAEGAELS